MTSKEAAADAPAIGIAELRSLWPAILEALKGYRRVAWLAFEGSAPLSIDGSVLAVGIREQGKVANINGGRHDEILRQAVLDVARVDLRIEPVLAPDLVVPATAVSGAPAAAAEASAPDTPSADDETVDDATGVDLAMQALGATTIGEIEH